MATKQFHISDILTVTTGRLISTRHIDAVYDLCSFMLHEQLFTHQLPRACKECRPELVRQFPAFAANASVDERVNEFCDGLKGRGTAELEAELTVLIAEMVERYGEFHEVTDMPATDSGPRDPIQELCEMVGTDKVVVVSPPAE